MKQRMNKTTDKLKEVRESGWGWGGGGVGVGWGIEEITIHNLEKGNALEWGHLWTEEIMSMDGG